MDFCVQFTLLDTEFLQRPPIKKSDLVEKIIKSNETEGLKSYLGEITRCKNSYEVVENINNCEWLLLVNFLLLMLSPRTVPHLSLWLFLRNGCLFLVLYPLPLYCFLLCCDFYSFNDSITDFLLYVYVLNDVYWSECLSCWPFASLNKRYPSSPGYVQTVSQIVFFIYYVNCNL